jgi:hypothetical protein
VVRAVQGRQEQVQEEASETKAQVPHAEEEDVRKLAKPGR